MLHEAAHHCPWTDAQPCVCRYERRHHEEIGRANTTGSNRLTLPLTVLLILAASSAFPYAASAMTSTESASAVLVEVDERPEAAVTTP